MGVDMPGMAHQWLFAHVSAGLCKWLVGNSNETATASEFAYPADVVPNRHRECVPVLSHQGN